MTRRRRIEVLLISVVAMIVAGLNFWLGRGLTEPSILPDEFGYLANAAFLAGIDWSPLVSTIQYYSLGYPILLAPLYWWGLPPAAVYSSALALNAALIGLVPILAFEVGLVLTGGRRRWLALGAATAIGVYPSYLIYSHLVLPESLLVLLVWLSAFLLARILERDAKARTSAVFGLVIGGACLVHQRSLGLCLASVAVMGLLWGRERVSRRAFGWFLFGVGAMTLVTICSKRLAVASLWAGRNERLPELVLSSVASVGGALRVAVTGLGQAYYLGAATLLLVFVGAQTAVRMSRGSWWQRPRPEVPGFSPMPAGTTESAAFLALHSLLSLFGSFALSVGLMSLGNRFDQLLYGRYNEAFMGPVLLLGVLTLSRALPGQPGIAKDALTAVAIFVLIGLGLDLLARDELARRGGFTLHITGLFLFKDPDWRIEPSETFLSLLALALTVALALRRFPPLGVAMVALYFLVVGTRVSHQLSLGSERHQDTGEISQWLRDQGVRGDVYFLRSGDHARDRMRERYQLWLPHLRLLPITRASQVEPARSHYLIAPVEFDGLALAGAVAFAADPIKTFRIWVTSPGEVARLRRSGTMPRPSSESLASDLVARHAVTMYRSKLEAPLSAVVLRRGPEGSLRRLLRLDEVPVRVSHLGTEDWPATVSIGVIWMDPGSPGRRLGEYRVALPDAMSPGEVENVEVPLRMEAREDEPIPPGVYEVWVGLVHEHVAWFYQHGDEVLKLQVRVSD